MDKKNETKRCKYEIICPEKVNIVDCRPTECNHYQVYEREIPEGDRIQAIYYELYREDMRDF